MASRCQRVYIALTMGKTTTDSVEILEPAAVPGKSRPYRWGYLQGTILIPLSLAITLIGLAELIKPNFSAWISIFIAILLVAMGALGLPLAIGILFKRRYALSLVYVMFILSLINAAVKVPLAVNNAGDLGIRGSAIAEAEWLLMWVLSLIYYRKRASQLR